MTGAQAGIARVVLAGIWQQSCSISMQHFSSPADFKTSRLTDGSPDRSLMSHRTLKRAGFILWQLSACFLRGRTKTEKQDREVQGWTVNHKLIAMNRLRHSSVDLKETCNKSVLNRLVSDDRRNLLRAENRPEHIAE